MTLEEIDKAIAEFCGWKLEPLDGRAFNGIPVMVWVNPDGERGFPIPCYSVDLNAMHEGEMFMRGTLKQFFNEPERYRMFNEYRYYILQRFGISATANERAEAFLRTVGKWRDE